MTTPLQQREREREADAEIVAGRMETFLSGEKFLDAPKALAETGKQHPPRR